MEQPTAARPWADKPLGPAPPPSQWTARGLRGAPWLRLLAVLAALAPAPAALGQEPAAADAPGQPADAPPGEVAPAAGEEPAPAEPEDVSARIERLAEEAAELVAAGDFEPAIGRYLEAYRLAPASALLYNVAYIYDRKLGEMDLALEYYRRYLRSADAEPAIVERALARVRELQDAGAGAGGSGSTSTGGGQATAPTVVRERRRSDPGTSSTRLAGWVVGGIGVGAVVGGIVAGLIAQDTHNRFNLSQNLAEKKDLRGEGRTQAIVADALLFTGGAALVTGVVLVIVGGGSDEEDAAWVEEAPRFTAAADGDSLLLGVGGTF